MSYDPQNSGEGTALPDYAAQGLTRRQIRELERAAETAAVGEDTVAAAMEQQVAAYVPPTIPSAQQIAAASAPVVVPVSEPVVVMPKPEEAVEISEPVQEVPEVAEVVAAESVSAVPVNAKPVSVEPEVVAVAAVVTEPQAATTQAASENLVEVASTSRKSHRIPLKHVVVRHKKAPKNRSSEKKDSTAPATPKRSVMQKILVVAVLLTCGAFMLATSIPANALLSESEVQRIKMETFLADQVAKSGQSIYVSDDGAQAISAARDGIDVTLAKQASSTGNAGAIFGGSRIQTNVPSSSGPIVWPLSSVRISSPYGFRWGALHAGLDMDPDEGTPIMAVADGIVAAVYPAGSSSFGNCTIIDHNVNGVKFSSLYAHQSAINVSVGQSVSAGQVIGAVGNTGNSTGAHLHLEIHVDNTAIDPYPFMLQYAGNPPG